MRASRALPVLALLLGGLPPSGARAQAPHDAAVRVDEIFAQWSSPTSPGCAVSVAEHGLTVMSRAWGMADLEHGIPNTPATIFDGGSVSKQFTAATVVLLALDGQLSLTDDVRRYVPEVPDYGMTITLRHLLTHTSGLRAGEASHRLLAGAGEQVAQARSCARHRESTERPQLPAGARILVQQHGGTTCWQSSWTVVSGMPFAEFSRKRIFEPLGLTDTPCVTTTAYRRWEKLSVLRPRKTAASPSIDPSKTFTGTVAFSRPWAICKRGTAR